MLEKVKKYGIYVLLLSVILVTSCEDDEVPEAENEVEVFTNVTLIFTNTADASDVVRARAVDPDGTGVDELEIRDNITLSSGSTYTLTYEILNALIPSDPEDIGAEILEEDNEHQFFFSFTNNAFTDPTGDGNRDADGGPINYNDEDENNNPVGLSTNWTTGDPITNGSFRVTLKHQPDIKTSTTTVLNGDTDFDLDFTLIIE